MGTRIPEYVTRTLASSLTGTIGVQTSGEKLFGDISQAGASVFNVSTPILAERKRVIDTVDATAKVTEFGLKVDESVRAAKETFSTSPRLGIKAVSDNLQISLNEFLNTIDDSQVKGLTASMASSVIRNNIAAMKSWANEQEVKNTGNNVAKAINLAAAANRLNPSIDGLNRSLVELEKSRELIGKVFQKGEKANKVMNDAAKSLALGTLYGFIKNNPVKAALLLEQGAFDSFLNNKEFKQFEEDVQKAIDGRETQIKNNKKIHTLGKSDVMMNIYKTTGGIPLETINALEFEWEKAGMMDDEHKQMIADYKVIGLQTKKFDSKEDAKTKRVLRDELRRLDITNKKITNSSLDQLISFKAKVLNKYSKGLIDFKEKEFLLDNIETPVSSAVFEQLERFDYDVADDSSRGFADIYNWWFNSGAPTYAIGYDDITDWVKAMQFSDENFADELRGEMLTEMLVEINFIIKQNILVTDEAVGQIVNKITTKAFVKLNPKFRFAKDGDVFELGNQKVMKQGNTIIPAQ